MVTKEQWVSGCEIWYYSHYTRRIRSIVYTPSSRYDGGVWSEAARENCFLSKEEVEDFLRAQQVIEELSASTR